MQDKVPAPLNSNVRRLWYRLQCHVKMRKNHEKSSIFLRLWLLHLEFLVAHKRVTEATTIAMAIKTEIVTTLTGTAIKVLTVTLVLSGIQIHTVVQQMAPTPKVISGHTTRIVVSIKTMALVKPVIVGSGNKMFNAVSRL
ncbi:MAG: hypothetical protein HW390_2633 [Candidatus Brocadiaceae bacterium]|nr:hypothetical protein [Candidatus Brocadiaceae bacterium]